MRKAPFLNNKELFFIEHNGIPGVGKLEVRNENFITIKVGGKGYQVDENYEVTETSNSITYNNIEQKSSFTIRFLELSDADKLFPDAIKTFNDIDSLTLTAQEALLSDGFAVEPEPTDIISFTVDDNNNVLELIKTTVDGDIFYRSAAGWVMVGQNEDIPTIFDQKVIDVDTNEIESATNLWDEAESLGKELAYDEIRPFAGIVQ